MRHPLAAALLVVVLSILRPSLSFAQFEEVRIAVDGLTCNLCAVGLERSLRTLDGVASVKVSLQDESALVTMKNGAGFDIEKFRGSVRDAEATTIRPDPGDTATKPPGAPSGVSRCARL